MPPPVHGAAMVGQFVRDSELINSEFDAEYINLATAKSLEDIGSLRLGKIASYFSLYRKIVLSVKKGRPDLVYITPNAKGVSFFKEYLIVQKIQSMGVKVIAHYHNKGVSQKQDNWLYDRLYRLFFKGLKVILLSERLFPDIEKYVNLEDVFFCPNAIPDNSENVGGKIVTSPHIRILFLSNLLPDKGPIVLLDALEILKSKGYVFVCDFVGSETKQLDRMLFNSERDRRGLSSVVFYHGKKYGEEKEIFWQKADLFVFPTKDECFPLVLLEAMQHHLPVISTREGGIPDIVVEGETGYLVEKGDSTELADRIENLILSPELRVQMGERGYERYMSNYSINIWEKHLCNILKAAIQ